MTTAGWNRTGGWRALALAGVLSVAGAAHASLQTLAPAGTPLNVPHNYVWSRMTTNGVYSGELVPFIAYQFNTFGGSGGTYTFGMTTVGFPGAINLYQGSFDPSQPMANFYADGVVTNAPGTISKSFTIPQDSVFEVVFSAATNGSAGTFSAVMTGPENVNVTTLTNVSIRVGPPDKTIAYSNSVLLRVYAVGPLPHSWQWYSGSSGDTSKPIAGATNAYYSSPVLVNNTSYWVKVTGPAGAGSANSGTADITVTGNPGAIFSGSLTPTNCVMPNGQVFTVRRFQVQTGGNYQFNITPGFNLATYSGVFDSAQPVANWWGVLDGFYAPGTYDLVISKASPGGNFSGSISNGPAIVALLPPLPPGFLSGPQDTTIYSMQTATLKVSANCGTAFTLQWYRGNSGNTNNPIAGATGLTYVTPALVTNTTYWARMTHAGGTADSGSATVFIASGPIGSTGALTACDRKFNRPQAPGQLSGTNVYYKTFVFTVTTDGTYTFAVNCNFGKSIYLYSGIFSPANPLLNLSAIPQGNTFNLNLLSGPNKHYLVVAGYTPTSLGNFDVTVTAGPALVTKVAEPVITNQPAGALLFRNEQTTLSVGSPSSWMSCQWYVGANCTNKFPISGATSNSYTTPPVTDYTNYWVELTTPGGYLFSQQATVGVKPRAFADQYSTPEDSPLVVGAPGIFGNDEKADSRNWAVVKITQPTNGTVTVAADGSFLYKSKTNYFGPDAFTYEVTDGSFNVSAKASITVSSVNDAPWPVPDALQTTVNTPVSVTMTKLLSNDMDPDGDPVGCVGYSSVSAQGGSVTHSNGVLTYTPPLDFFGTDTFHYTAGDGWGYTTEGDVTVLIPNPELRQLHIARTANGYHIWFLGDPGMSYMVQTASELKGPWTDLKLCTAKPSGLVELDEAFDPQVKSRFYRAVKP